jgi:hypothetical protein
MAVVDAADGATDAQEVLMVLVADSAMVLAEALVVVCHQEASRILP